MATDLGPKAAQQPASRADVARQLLACLERLAAQLGDVSLADEMQVLKREPAHGHAILSAPPEDNTYLSVVTLV
jgi:hypothetical protein